MKKILLWLCLSGSTMLPAADEMISPDGFAGSDSDRIEKAIAESVKRGENRILIPAMNRATGKELWVLDRTIVLPDRFTLLLQGARLAMAPAAKGPVVRNLGAERISGDHPWGVEIMGYGSARGVLQANGACAIELVNARGFVVSNLEILRGEPFAVNLLSGCADGRLRNLRFSDREHDGIATAEGVCGVTAEHLLGVCRRQAAPSRGVTVRDDFTQLLESPRPQSPAPAELPALIPAPRRLVMREGVFLAPGPYVTRDWIAFSREASLGEEAYRLRVAPEGVSVVAGGLRGELHAMTTLRQLAGERPAFRNIDDYDGGDIGKPLVVPCCEIEDAPAFAYRGMLIDECRHFFGKETLKQVLDDMAYHKFNVLHWHLTEDQGWRLAIGKHPKLVEYGAVRPASPRRHAAGASGLDGVPYGPYFYTQDDVREIVAYAAARGIEIVPEIEFPGHVRALLAAYPEYSCRGASLPRRPRCEWGIEEEVLCVGNEAALKAIEEILDEVVALFPGRFVHIGGDECPVKRWRQCEKCRARARELGLAGPEQLQGYVTGRFTRYLAAKGRRAIGWDEILDCEITPETVVMSWRGIEGGVKGAMLGHQAIVCPVSHCYLNRRAGIADDPGVPGRGKDFVSAEKVYGFDPCAGVPDGCRASILGSQACFWSEVIENRTDLEWKMWPRSCALAEVLWTAPEKRDWPAFKARLATHRRVLLDRGIHCAPLE